MLNDGILRVEDVQSSGVPYAEVVDNEKPANTIDISPKPPQNLLPLPILPNQEQETIKLGKERSVFISYPDNISEKELEIIKKHLDIIKFRNS